MASPKRKREEVSASFFPGGLAFKVVQRSTTGTDLMTATSTHNIWASRRRIVAALAKLGFKKGPAPKA